MKTLNCFLKTGTADRAGVMASSDCCSFLPNCSYVQNEFQLKTYIYSGRFIQDNVVLTRVKADNLVLACRVTFKALFYLFRNSLSKETRHAVDTCCIKFVRKTGINFNLNTSHVECCYCTSVLTAPLPIYPTNQEL